MMKNAPASLLILPAATAARYPPAAQRPPSQPDMTTSSSSSTPSSPPAPSPSTPDASPPCHRRVESKPIRSGASLVTPNQIGSLDRYTFSFFTRIDRRAPCYSVQFLHIYIYIYILRERGKKIGRERAGDGAWPYIAVSLLLIFRIRHGWPFAWTRCGGSSCNSIIRILALAALPPLFLQIHTICESIGMLR